jgi:hypothetical protein
MTAAIEVDGVSKWFNIPCEKATTLYDSIANSLMGRNKCEDFWVLKGKRLNSADETIAGAYLLGSKLL